MMLFTQYCDALLVFEFVSTEFAPAEFELCLHQLSVAPIKFAATEQKSLLLAQAT